MRAVFVLAIVLMVGSGLAGTAVGTPPAGDRYTVVPGDSLSLIAQRLGLSLGELVRVNHVDPVAPLQIGTVLRIPSARAGVTITVRSGDTLSGIAARYGISLASLVRLNQIDMSTPILIGQQLRIPSVRSLEDIARSQANPYSPALRGFDVSYPDCARPLPPEGDFVIVGLNGGRPFTANPCFAEQYAAVKAAGQIPSVYVNSAYAPSLRRHITSDCLQAGESRERGRARQLAYAVGCSEAAAAVADLAGLPMAAIWIDVEPANTWSKHAGLNRATIAGLSEALLTRMRPAVVGVYSADVYWEPLMGGWSSFTFPEWIATGPGRSCSTPFAAGPVWLSQHATTRDRDHGC